MSKEQDKEQEEVVHLLYPTATRRLPDPRFLNVAGGGLDSLRCRHCKA